MIALLLMWPTFGCLDLTCRMPHVQVEAARSSAQAAAADAESLRSQLASARQEVTGLQQQCDGYQSGLHELRSTQVSCQSNCRAGLGFTRQWISETGVHCCERVFK